VFEDSDYNDVSHRLAANGSYTVLPEWFFVRGQASYTDTIIDPALGYNYGGSGLFNETNLARSRPRWSSRHAPRVPARGGRCAVFVRSRLVSRLPDAPPRRSFAATTTTPRTSARSEPQHGRSRSVTTARAYYEWQASDFETLDPVPLRACRSRARSALVESLRLVGDGGSESDLDEDTTDGGLDTAFWHAGFQWRPDSHTLLDARYGERFFGDSWSCELQRDAAGSRSGLVHRGPGGRDRRLNADFDPAVCRCRIRTTDSRSSRRFRTCARTRLRPSSPPVRARSCASTCTIASASS
jgi:hypothetical protein